MKSGWLLKLMLLAMATSAGAGEAQSLKFDSLSFPPASVAQMPEISSSVVISTVPRFSANVIESGQVASLFDGQFSPREQAELHQLGITPQLPVQQIAKLVNTTREAAGNLAAAKLASAENVPVFEQLNQVIKDHYIGYDEKYIRSMDPVLWNKWLEIFKQKQAPVKLVDYQLPKGSFIFELRTPRNAEERLNLFKELDYFKRQGCIGVVTVWDGNANYQDLVDLQCVLKMQGWRIWTAFSTSNYLYSRIYIDPERYAAGLRALAKNSEAFLLGWRRTSIHLFVPNTGWTNYTMQQARRGNPEIAFIGEYYFGYNGTQPEGEWHEYVNLPANINAVLVVNLGYLSVDPNEALRQVRRQTGDRLPLISLIQGETAYYLTRNNTHRTKEVNQRITKLLEERFLNAGFAATGIIAGDGSDGLYDAQVVDNLCQTKNHQN